VFHIAGSFYHQLAWSAKQVFNVVGHRQYGQVGGSLKTQLATQASAVCTSKVVNSAGLRRVNGNSER
jgi:hypothetical protein